MEYVHEILKSIIMLHVKSRFLFHTYIIYLIYLPNIYVVITRLTMPKNIYITKPRVKRKF